MSILNDFNEIVTKLQATSSRLEKEAILRSYADNKGVKQILKFIFDPYIVTGISKKKVAKIKSTSYNFESTWEVPYKDFSSALRYFSENHTGRDDDLEELARYAHFNCEYEDLVYSIITKDVKIGVQPATLNKVYGKGFIDVFEVMLGSKYFDNPDKLVKDGTYFILTQKLDGVRCVCIKENGSVKFFSRQGQPILDLVDIEQEACMYLLDGYVYDGELLLKNDTNLPSKDLYRATVKVTSSDNVKKGLIFNCFDIIPVDKFKEGKWQETASNRKYLVEQVMRSNPMRWIKEVPMLYLGSNKDRINEYLNQIVNAGGEGVMINLADSPYECKRSSGLLKVKKMQTCDIRCIDVVEGTGQNSGKLGAAVCEFEGPDNNIYRVNVGSGFTLLDREQIWMNPNTIVGKIIEVQYFEISQNEQGGYSLRFPVFKHIRDDKTEISMN